MASAPVEVGDMIAGKYRVERVVGEGGMGIVVAARHTELDQTVAIKFLLSEIAEHEMASERFRREAWAAARIRGEHVCRVLDVGIHGESGLPFMVMEYLDGCDLASELVTRGSLPAEEAVGYVLQACEALAEAHAAGIVHRDLKPANLFLAERADGTRGIKVLDFGVSKLLSDSGASGLTLTSTKTLVGSPLYMSPEQLDSAKGVDARTDVWALGVVLYELVTGQPPFNGTSIGQLVNAVLHSEPVALSERGIDAPDGFEATVLRAVRKQREDRFESVAEMAAELAPFGPPSARVSAARAARLLSFEATGQQRATRGSTTGEVTGSGNRPSSGSESTPVAWERDSTASSKRKVVGVVAALAALLGAGVVAIAMRSGKDPAAPADAEPHMVKPAAATVAPDQPAEQEPAGAVPGIVAASGDAPQADAPASADKAADAAVAGHSEPAAEEEPAQPAVEPARERVQRPRVKPRARPKPKLKPKLKPKPEPTEDPTPQVVQPTEPPADHPSLPDFGGRK